MLFMLFIESECASAAQVALGKCCRETSSEVCEAGPELSSDRSGSPMSASGGRAMGKVSQQRTWQLRVLLKRSSADRMLDLVCRQMQGKLAPRMIAPSCRRGGQSVMQTDSNIT